jgi:hypothetical protein
MANEMAETWYISCAASRKIDLEIIRRFYEHENSLTARAGYPVGRAIGL